MKKTKSQCFTNITSPKRLFIVQHPCQYIIESDDIEVSTYFFAPSKEKKNIFCR
jgi:hypothetical protein